MTPGDISELHMAVRQALAGGALLGWTRDELMRRAEAGHVDIGLLQGGKLRPEEAEALIVKLRAILEAEGIEFIDGASPGVRLRPPPESLRAEELNASNDD